MKKYLAIIKTEFQRMLTYRLDYFGFRLAGFLQLFSTLIIWIVIFKNQDVVSGYTYEEMVTYVLIGWMFFYLTNSYGFEDNIARDIHRGDLSNFLLKPISYVRYMTVLSIGRASVAVFTGMIMIGIMLLMFHGSVLTPSGAVNVLIIVAMVLVGYFIRLFLSILTGFIAFWTIDISGPYHTINVLIRILTGSYFPISMLPALAFKASLFLPFAYFVFMPTELYLGKMTTSAGLRSLVIEVLWLLLLYLLIKVVWRFGLRKYEAVGT